MFDAYLFLMLLKNLSLHVLIIQSCMIVAIQELKTVSMNSMMIILSQLVTVLINFIVTEC